MLEVAKRIYIGSGANGEQRLANIRKLARKYFGGSVSKLFNDALDKVYRLDSQTGEEISEKEFMVADTPPPSYPRKNPRKK